MFEWLHCIKYHNTVIQVSRRSTPIPEGSDGAKIEKEPIGLFFHKLKGERRRERERIERSIFFIDSLKRTERGL